MLHCQSLRKSFYDPARGEVRAVDAIDLHLEPGVVALVGANGAGKSTLLRLIATLLTPDSGRLLVDGIDAAADPAAVRRRLGYLSTTTRLYQRLTGRELLHYTGGLHGLDGTALDAAVAAQVEGFALAEFLDQRIEGLSTGQLQRLNLARALLAQPPLLVLDEPTTGLDLAAAHAVVEAVRASRTPGRLIIVATHVMAEVEAVADRLVVMRRGRVVFDGAPAGLGSGAAFAAAVLALVRADDAVAA